MNILKAVLGSVAEKAVDVVDQFVEDKDKAAELKAALITRFSQSADNELNQKSSIIKTEATGESWLQRNWRPILMLVIVAIVANNFLIAPYLKAMFGADAALSLDLPENLWDLMTIGVGGYVASRGIEKSIKNWRDPGS